MSELFQPATQFQDISSPLTRRRKSKRPLFFILFLIVLALIIFVVSRLLGTSTTKIAPIPNPTMVVLAPTDTPMPTASLSASPTQAPSIAVSPTIAFIDKATGLDRSNLSILIQNGGGTVGAGKKASDFFTKLGYVVTGAENADSFTYDTTTIQIKSSKSSYLALLKKDLAEFYTIGTTSATLGSDAKADAVIIIGK